LNKEEVLKKYVMVNNFNKVKECGCDVNYKDEYERVPLHYVNDSKITTLLVESGAKLETDFNGVSVFHSIENVEVLKFYVKHIKLKI